jgi:hypothetical protein
MSESYNLGFYAFLNNCDLNDNPYDWGSFCWEFWREGFMDSSEYNNLEFMTVKHKVKNESI